MVKYVNNIDLNGLQILNMCIEKVESIPNEKQAGRVVYHVFHERLYFCNGISWDALVGDNDYDGVFTRLIDRVEALEANPQSPSESLNKHIELIGDGALNEYNINHNLNTQDIVVSVFDKDNNMVQASIKIVDNNNIIIKTNDVVQSDNQLKVVIIG